MTVTEVKTKPSICFFTLNETFFINIRMNGHHLILGELVDYISGEKIKDTHDERYRQNIAHLLIEKKGFLKSDIMPHKKLIVQADEKKAIVFIDFVISLFSDVRMIIKYGPGSLVTRHRPALAASRVCSPYQVPVVVVTNGEDADILEGISGKIMFHGLESIPEKQELIELTKDIQSHAISEKQAEMESRIFYAFEVDDSCPCDDTICRL